MTCEWYELHPVTPQARFIAKAVECVRNGGVIAYPTDSCYALGVRLDDRDAAERLRRIRGIDKHHRFTLVCRDLSEISRYAKVDNTQFRLLKALTPGPYTFVLPASKELPKRLSHEKRKTVGIRIPEHPVCRLLLDALDEPLISGTLQFPDDDEPVSNLEELREQIERLVDLVLDAGDCGTLPTTVLDLSGEAPELLRQGKGDVSHLGL